MATKKTAPVKKVVRKAAPRKNPPPFSLMCCTGAFDVVRDPEVPGLRINLSFQDRKGGNLEAINDVQFIRVASVDGKHLTLEGPKNGDSELRVDQSTTPWQIFLNFAKTPAKPARKKK